MYRSLPLKLLPFTMVLSSCLELEPNAPSPQDSVRVEPLRDTLTLQEKFYRNIDSIKVDTSTLQGKIESTILEVMKSVYPAYAEDTLFDINFDGNKDLIFFYYGLAGTGIKNRMIVYYYEPKTKRFTFNKQLSDMANPSFYLERRKITGFYIGHGGGDGIELEWIKDKWDTVRAFSVSNAGDSSIWEVSSPQENKRELIRRPFMMLPPAEILETKF